MATGVALVVSGALGSTYLISSLSETQPVLALSHDVARGAVLTSADVVVVDLHAGPGLRPVPGAQLDSVLGRRASTMLPAGSLLTAASTTNAVVPARGEAVVGVWLTPAQMPAEQLLAGDTVRIVSTPLNQADPPEQAPQVLAGTVVSTSAPDQSGAVTVDVLVSELQAPELAASAATGRVALVLDSRAA